MRTRKNRNRLIMRNHQQEWERGQLRIELRTIVRRRPISIKLNKNSALMIQLKGLLRKK